MNIPLINSNSKQDINTSLIAIRNAINELSRMKESESVEDLQRQINIINQQIANFNSEFSAINTHLNTIDTNILNLQPVDTVASGNLHSVTSNAVATQTVRTDLLIDPDFNTLINFGIWQIALTGSIPITDLHAPVLSAGTLYVGLPKGGENITQIFIQDYDNWMAFRHINTRLGFYENWVSTKIERKTLENILTSSNLSINFSRAEIRNGICYLYARFTGTGTLTDGMVFANLNQFLRPVREVGFTVYNQSTNKNYYVILNTDGNLYLWWNENTNVNYDFFISVTYVLY